ncbi:S9 family peptidase [Porphyromonas circumdentaria]|uniref:Xaa-Xaa-Pro tripeptidyl-peptidase n=1 Tax=Porphyromonas circumdentaria TaxID=29524 RepID=A0A1T4NS40_9PORP|nr:alpha/beta fold hydrolase [Porphyromonas circumdentaria]MBB6276175.1 dipeptidyl-peptidase-4/Xaa-Xaa-Pro tripeptidyl-peptidase [Porphyromonas circumdentaria]SJZ82121.1 Xaa-Xaa-Pro tripeptidyl-peptidase [Porphyromonas circumdentaria]
MKKIFLQALLAIPFLFGAVQLQPEAMAQRSPGLYTLEDVTMGGRTFLDRFYPQYKNRLQWIGDRAIYVEGESILLIEGKKGTKELLTLKEIRRIIPHEEVFEKSTFFPMFRPIKGYDNWIGLSSPTGYYIVDVKSKSLVRSFNFLPAEGVEPYTLLELSPDATHALLRSSKGELLITSALNSSTTHRPSFELVACNESDTILYGEAVHQREFGIEKGVFWSPDGSKLAFYRMDQSMVAPYPIVTIMEKKAQIAPLRYPMAGDPSHHVTLGIYDLATRKITYMKTGGDPEHYLTNIAWAPDAKSIFMAEINRAQTRSDVNQYDVATGNRIKNIFTEEDSKYIEPSHPMVFLPGSDKEFIWLSRADGFNHIYCGNITNGKLRQVTSGAWEVLAFKGFDKEGKTLFFEATKASPLETRLYSVRLDGSKLTDLTPDKGVHHTQFNASFTSFIDTYSSTTVPRNIVLRSTSGKVVHSILTAPDPTKEYRMPKIELGSITSKDGSTELYYRLIKPLDFDANKKYPVIVYVYGGPHAQLVTNSWMGGARGWDIYMAQKGYIVFTLDNRGSANRGRDFEQVIHRQVGTVEMEDQMQGVDFLLSHNWVDRDRIGVYGWSFGGFMTTNLMLTHPDVFKVGVAGGPVMDWSRYEIMYGERYNDTPNENPEGYKANNLTLRAKDLKGRLLLIHGAVDPVVVWQHAQAFVEQAIKARTYPDCMYYPTHEHNVTGPDRVHLNTTIARYFEDFL